MTIRRWAESGVISRGPTDDDYHIVLEAVEIHDVIEGPSTGSELSRGANYQTYVSATTRNRFQITKAVHPESFDQGLENLNPEVATLNGLSTEFVSEGKCIIRQRGRMGHRTLTLDHAIQPGVATRSWAGTFAANSLAYAAVQQIDPRLVGKNPVTDKVIRTGTVNNATCWAADFDWSGAIFGGSRGMAAVSPLHVITASHAGVATEVTFIASDGSLVPRTTVSHVVLNGGLLTDIRVSKLNEALPNNVRKYKVLPSNLNQYLPDLTETRMPIIFCDQEGKALVVNLGVVMEADNKIYGTVPANSVRASFNEAIVGGDSSSPSFLPLAGELIYLGPMTYGGAGGVSSVHTLLNEINAAMALLGGGYQLTTVNLGNFPNFG